MLIIAILIPENLRRKVAGRSVSTCMLLEGSYEGSDVPAVCIFWAEEVV
jgi:hypothetical protein